MPPWLYAEWCSPEHIDGALYLCEGGGEVFGVEAFPDDIGLHAQDFGGFQQYFSWCL